MRKKILALTALLFSAGLCLAVCPPPDLTGDCLVNYEDFALMAAYWLAGDPCIPDDMTLVPGGTYAMGDSFGEGEADELPVHTVTVDWLYMGKYEVTNGQYCDYLNSALSQGLITVTDDVVYRADSGTTYPYCDTHTANSESYIGYGRTGFSVMTKSDRDMSNDPMVLVSWYGAAAYCNWRGAQEGYQQLYTAYDPNWACDLSKRGYRLATEVEWEYAARGGLAGKRFPWGDTISHTYANYWACPACSPYDVNPTEGFHPAWYDGVRPYTAVVGSFPANGYGLYDMTGNVFELCNDFYSDSYYASSPTDNPTGPTTGWGYVLRGGGWGQPAYNCRIAKRYGYWPMHRGSGIGFRVVLDLK